MPSVVLPAAMLLQIEMVFIDWSPALSPPQLILTDHSNRVVAGLERIKHQGLSVYGKVLIINGVRHLGVLRIETSITPQVWLSCAIHNSSVPHTVGSVKLSVNELLFQRDVLYVEGGGTTPYSMGLLCASVKNDSNTAIRLVHIQRAIDTITCSYSKNRNNLEREDKYEDVRESFMDPWDRALRQNARKHIAQLHVRYMTSCSR